VLRAVRGEVFEVFSPMTPRWGMEE